MRLNTSPSGRRQAGFGYTGYMIIMAVSIFIGLFAFKVGPHYMENWTVTKVAEGLVAKPEILSQSRSKVYEYINQAYRTNNLWGVKGEDTIILTRDAKLGYIVAVQYERRSKLLHNIDVVTSFNKMANGAP